MQTEVEEHSLQSKTWFLLCNLDRLSEYLELGKAVLLLVDRWDLMLWQYCIS